MAEVNLKITSDTKQAIAGMEAIVAAANRIGQTAQQSAAAGKAIYQDETRALDLRSRGLHLVAADLENEISLKRNGLKLAKELQITETEGIKLARERLAVERQIAEAQNAKRSPPELNRISLSGDKITPNRAKSLEEYEALFKAGGPRPSASGAGGSRGSGGSGAYNAGIIYNAGQDLLQGGPMAILNNVPQLLGVVSKYKSAISLATSAVGVVAAGVTAGYAIADWKGFSEIVGKLTTNFEEELQATRAWNDAQHKRLTEYNQKRALEKAAEKGAAQGGSAENLAKGQALGIESRAQATALASQGRERQVELQRLQIEAEMDTEVRARKLRDLDKAWLVEKAERNKRIADAEYESALSAQQEAKAALNALERAAEAAKLAAGSSGTSPELERIRAARGGIESRANSTDQTLRNAAAARDAANAGIAGANAQAAEVERKYENEKIERYRKFQQDRATKEAEAEKQASAKAAAEAKKESERRVKDFFKGLGDAVDVGVSRLEKLAKRLDDANKRGLDDKQLQILELRARGRGKQADRLEKDATIGQIAKERMALGDTPEDAQSYAERKYAVDNPRGGARRISGAGHRNRPASPDTPSGLDSPIGGGIDGGGGLDALRRLNSRSRAFGAVDSTKPVYSGLDGLDALQQKNQRIRGAGFKGTQGGAAEATASAAAGAVAGPGAAAALPAILNALSSLGKKLDTLTSASRTIRR